MTYLFAGTGTEPTFTGKLNVQFTTSTADDEGVQSLITLGADIDTVAAFNGTINGFASGGTNGNISSVYQGTLLGNANDTEHEYYVFWGATANKNGGDSTMIFLGNSTGYDDAILLESGNISFVEYAATIQGSQDEEDDRDGDDLTIKAMPGYDSGAVARAGGNLILEGGTKANAGNEGTVLIKVLDGVIADAQLANSQACMYLNEAGNTLVFKVKYAAGTVKTGTVALS